MDANLIITPEARDVLDEVYAWYEKHREGKGEEFLLQVDSCIAAILRTPEMHAVTFENCRRALIRKFPYVVIDELEGDNVLIYGVFHTSRDQAKWRRRLP